MSKYIKCPRCRCNQLNVIEDNREDVGRGVLGYMLTGSLYGALAYSNTKKSVFQCNMCGHVFKTVW